ncbi:Uncharacterized protein Adt_16689 [Abeliophyllum distichum]|uniref:Uncharacterized protein n=1 Tax=Abeliophyllum distichum TaxID=126358 RepID=A0ABD1TEE5_9LAMI
MSHTQVLSEPTMARHSTLIHSVRTSVPSHVIQYILSLSTSVCKDLAKRLSQTAGQYMIYTLSPKSQFALHRPTPEPTLAQPHHPRCEPPEKQAITASSWNSMEPRSKAIDKIEEGTRLAVEEMRQFSQQKT